MTDHAPPTGVATPPRNLLDHVFPLHQCLVDVDTDADGRWAGTTWQQRVPPVYGSWSKAS